MQGLYPPNENLGENLNELQLKRSDPPVNISDSTIEQKKINLNNDSLPNSMVFILFESLNILSLSECHGGGGGGGGGPPPPPGSPPPSHNQRGYDIENEFNEKYKEKFNQFEGIESGKNYTFHEISDICDNYIADYVDGREMSNFSKFFDLDEFYEYCLRQFEIEQIQSRISTEERQYASGTYFMGLLINYTKLKIDEDLGINNSTNPKMLIVSGHDTTLNTQQFFMQFALGTSSNFSRNPTFASQMAFEIKRNDDKQNRNYSDYFINYYFNDELILNMTVEKFLNIMEPHIMSSEQINAVCNSSDNNNGNNNSSSGNETDNNNSSGNGTDNNTNTNNQTEGKVTYVTVQKNNYRNALVIVFASLLGVSLIVNVFTIYKLLNKNKGLEQKEKENVESTIAGMQNNKNI